MNNPKVNNSGIIGNFMEALRLVFDSLMEGAGYRFDLFEMELQEVSQRYTKMYMLLQVQH